MTVKLSTFVFASVGLLSLAAPASAAETHIFPGVTPAIFECLKGISEVRNGTVYEPRYADRGTATTSSALWSIVIDYVFDPATGDLNYTIIRKTFLIPVQAVWDGITDLIAECTAG